MRYFLARKCLRREESPTCSPAYGMQVFLELVDTERTYVRDLNLLVAGLLIPLRRALRESQESMRPSPLACGRGLFLFEYIFYIYIYRRYFLMFCVHARAFVSVHQILSKNRS